MLTVERATTAGPSAGPRRWPAYGVALLSLAYAGGKAVFAARSRLGLPGGPVVPAAEHERYAREVMDVAVVQWLGAATGLLAALIVLASVTAAGRRAPRTMLVLLAGVVLGLGSGAAVMALDCLVGLGIGWGPAYGVVGVVACVLLVGTVHSYVGATAVLRSGGGSASPWPGRGA